VEDATTLSWSSAAVSEWVTCHDGLAARDRSTASTHPNVNDVYSTSQFLSRVSIQHTDARHWYSNSVRQSVRLSVRDVPVLDEDGLTLSQFFHHTV